MTDTWNEILSNPPMDYDDTWRWRFKWAYDSQTGKAEAWKTVGGSIDGRPSHRAEVRERWGRDPKVRDGDVLGVASYIPAETKLDGTVVAPPEVQLQAYYDQPIPDAIRLWFAEQFPEATIRQATLVYPRLGKKTAEFSFEEVSRPDVIKWVWNKRDGTLIWATDENNLPTHTQKTQAEWGRPLQRGVGGFDGPTHPDYLGFAYPEPGKVEIDAYSNVPPAALAAVKTQLAEWFPHDQIITEAGDVPEFSSDPAQYRSAARAWVESNLGSPAQRDLDGLQSYLEGTRGESGLLGRLLPKWASRRTADADMDGAMVALFIPEDAAKKLKIRGGEPVENMHITLLYFSDKANERDDWDEVKKIVAQVASQTQPLSGKVSGYGIFDTPDGDVLWASPSVQGLAELRHKLFEACEDAGFHVNTEHDWAPHITLKYKHKGSLPKNTDVELEFKELSFAQGEDHHDFEFTGSFEKKAMRRLAAQRLGFIKIAPDINELAKRAIINLERREDLAAMIGPRWIDGSGRVYTDEEIQGAGNPVGITQNPKWNPTLYNSIFRTLNYLPAELFKFYPWVVKQIKNWYSSAAGGTPPWGSTQHLQDILVQAFQHMEYLRSQPPGSPNTAPVPDINQLDFPALEQWVYQRNAMGIDVRPGFQWEYTEGKPKLPMVNSEGGEYPHVPQQQRWDLGEGWYAWPVWSEQDLKQEGDMMGHCVGGYCNQVQDGQTVIFSIRDPKGEPHVTIELEPDKEGGYDVIQVQGKQNTEPAEEYKNKVRTFFSLLQQAGHSIAQVINVEDANDLEELEYVTPASEYGVPSKANVDYYTVARELVERAADGYGIATEEDSLDKLISEGLINADQVRFYIRDEGDAAIDRRAAELASNWEDRRCKLWQDFVNDWHEDRASSEDDYDEDADPDEEDFEYFLEQHYPDEYEGEMDGFRYQAEDELPDVVNLIQRFSSTQKISSDDYLDWSGWEGAHRFVTDGKEILTDPETEPIGENEWKSPLESKFREIHPDAKSFTSGWIVPTADGMGVGIWAPAAGHGDKHEPGLHEIIQVVEKELGKPAHLITNHEYIADQKMYDPGTVSEWQSI